MPFGFHLPFGMKVPIGCIYPLVSIYPSGWKVSVESIYPSGWKCSSGPFTLWVLFILQVPFYPSSWKVPVRSIYPSGWKVTIKSIYPSGSVYPSRWKFPLNPFTFRVGKCPSGYQIPMLDYTKSQTVCVFPTHASLYGKNLHTMPKDPSTYSYPSSMGSRALRSWNINSISFIQKKILCSWDLGQPYTTI